jgi:AraC family transcriptional regulator
MHDPNPDTSVDVRFEQGRPLLLAGLRQWYTYETMYDIPAIWDRFGPYFGKVPNGVGREAYGVIFNMMPGGNGFDYMAAVEVSSLDGLPAEFAHIEFPARTYAVFKHESHISQLRETMDFMWKQWLPNSGREVAPGPNGGTEYFELYDAEFDPADGVGHVELWLPVKG